ncbi:EthD family reductase [Actinokineospora auranticolor]|uniref:Uncharacterized protein (TIGR02118 family) n=1 Tax=Actinokineospora auranticolor TaxID=155976 RepID=A0A2S6GJQ9_9PSEU|nr:EthD family reductase [Actinokineospora auranticolor]PPK65433.1 uncharacterized protein (TIGR02118 family) [Actinokineospora auranticolor]
MIHQLIFAAPRPGLSVEDFQNYWREVHAVRYASKIPQIRKYKIDTTVSGVTPEPLWYGVAEIWLANETDQLASLQTDEFLQGARLDEPKWAAFWQTLVLDTDAHVLLEGDIPGTAEPGGAKLIRLAKRAEGLPLADFREQSLGAQGELALRIPGLRRYLQGHTRDGAYGVGEAVLDVAYQYWFSSVAELEEARRSPEFKVAEEQLLTIARPRYVHDLVVEEHWIIGPDAR